MKRISNVFSKAIRQTTNIKRFPYGKTKNKTLNYKLEGLRRIRLGAIYYALEYFYNLTKIKKINVNSVIKRMEIEYISMQVPRERKEFKKKLFEIATLLEKINL